MYQKGSEGWSTCEGWFCRSLKNSLVEGEIIDVGDHDVVVVVETLDEFSLS